MRIAILGGTRFVGPAIVEELLAHSHEPIVIHRGRVEPIGAPDAPRVHCDRHDVDALRAAITEARPDAIVDTSAFTRADVEHAAMARRGLRAHTIVLSSIDVYRAFATVLDDAPATDAVPLDESSALRGSDRRFIRRGHPRSPHSDADPETYEKIEVESAALARGATVLRLPMVYGERDVLVREGFVLDRLRAGRTRMPFGAGNWLSTRGYVRDVARAVRLAAERDDVAGEVFDVGEARTVSIDAWARKIAAIAGRELELVRVPDAVLPPDLQLTRAVSQHLLVSSEKARRALGWEETDPEEALRRSVEWHLAQPARPFDGAADDRALRGGV